MIDIQAKDRLVIYSYYDKDGEVDRFVTVFLDGIREVAEDILVVVNGTLTEESVGKLESAGASVLFRENSGLDIWGYKEGLEYMGWEKLRGYKEVILCNATVFGPVYPFCEMFDRMARNEKLDFWGISSHASFINENDPNLPVGMIPEHIQSYFCVYRQSLLRSPELEEYWRNLPRIEKYSDAVGKHEIVFTKYFADRGYSWDVYVRGDEEEATYIHMFDPYLATVKYRSPVIKRKLFFLGNHDLLLNSLGERVGELVGYLKKEKLFDLSLIYENIIRCNEQGDFINCFNLRFILPEDYSTDKAVSCEGKVGYLEFSSGDTPTELISRICKEASLHPYLCIVCNDGPKSNPFNTSQRSFMDLQRRCVRASAAFESNVTGLFESDSFLGMLVPEPPLTRTMHAFSRDNWDESFDAVRNALSLLGINVPCCRESRPAVPLGGCMWVRTSALKNVLDKLGRCVVSLSMMEFMHLLPFLVQGGCFAPGYLSTDKVAGLQISALSHYAGI